MDTTLTHFAQQLRKNQTEAEKKLWRHLRAKQICNLKFRRQQPIGPYIVDFVNLERKIIIELDGSQHIDEKDNDIERDAWLLSQGYEVIRFWNNEILLNMDGVLNKIHTRCNDHPPLTPPLKGGG